MPRTAIHCERCDEHVIVDGNVAEVKRFIAEHMAHGCVVGEETDRPGEFLFEHQIGLLS